MKLDIEELYKLIPDFHCLPGCYECCRSFGVPSRTRVEDERIREFLRARGIEIHEAKGTSCPYASEKGCAIYPVRPLTCRIYGTSVNYQCKMGVRPLRLLQEDEEAEIFYLYRKNFF